ncbi:MAG: Hsp70 family protein [Bacteroidales bacterium]|nr:Hsp70 family protein [Bacteroidales bacterium]
MTRIKIDYGIDLGTTNSSICRMEKGNPVVIKTDTQKETLPSCVSINKKGSIKTGDGAYNTMKSDKRRATRNWVDEGTNTYIEFKRTMGTDTLYASPNAGRQFTSEQLSAEILKSLKSFVTDEQVRSAVITVPAKFTVGQKTATLHAASLAGFEHCELLQEPIAAAFAYGYSSDNKDGIWMVFDFGGGTFDAALLRSEEGILQVFDTAGDNYLGGKDLDNAIVDKIIIPYLQKEYSIEGILSNPKKNIVFRDAMKTYAEEVKNQLSFKESEDIISNLGDLGLDDNGDEIELDITVEQKQVFDAMRPTFQKAIDICKNLLDRNSLKGNNLEKLILVGGPTYSPLIRQMLKEQVSPNIDSSINPMTAVATGATLYAATLDSHLDDDEVVPNGVKLKLKYNNTSVANSEWVAISVDTTASTFTDTSNLQVELLRTDKAWASGKFSLANNKTTLEVNLLNGKNTTFSIFCYDHKGNRVECQPSEFTIVGMDSPIAIMPYYTGIAFWDTEREKKIFQAARGLEKNKALPAIGVINGLRTSRQLRPGISSDIMTVPVYQCEDNPSVGRNADLYEYVADIVVNGEEVPTLIPENSPIDITLKMNSSEQMTMDIYFPSADFSISKILDTSKKQNISEIEKQIHRLIEDAHNGLQQMKELGISTQNLAIELSSIVSENRNSNEKKAILQHLKEILRRIEELDAETEWLRLEKEIRETFDSLDYAFMNLNIEMDKEKLATLRQNRDQILSTKNVNLGRNFLEQLTQVYNQQTILYQCINWIEHLHKNFLAYSWKDEGHARRLLNSALPMLNQNPKESELYPVFKQIMGLLNDDVDLNDGNIPVKGY